MKDWRIKTGVILGLAMAILFGAIHGFWQEPDSPVREHGPILSDCDGAIRELVIQYVADAADTVTTTYRQFLSQLPGDITVYVVVPDRDAFDDLAARLGRVPCRLAPVVTRHPMTTWSRDRWLAFHAREGKGPGLVLSPREETAAGVWPQRKGDQRIGEDLATFLSDRFVSKRSALAFDGGDFTADKQTVFVTPHVLLRNEGITVPSRSELETLLSRLTRKEIVLLENAPPHHAGMFMMPVGGNTVLVGDPSLAINTPGCRSGSTRSGSSVCPVPRPDFSADTQARFDTVAAECVRAGYRVVRIPVIPDRDARTYLTYLNVIIDERGGRRIVYMPSYSNAGKLNANAIDVWESIGYEVRPVDCTRPYVHAGSLRCLVNVLSRSASRSRA